MHQFSFGFFCSAATYTPSDDLFHGERSHKLVFSSNAAENYSQISFLLDQNESSPFHQYSILCVHCCDEGKLLHNVDDLITPSTHARSRRCRCLEHLRRCTRRGGETCRTHACCGRRGCATFLVDYQSVFHKRPATMLARLQGFFVENLLSSFILGVK